MHFSKIYDSFKVLPDSEAPLKAEKTTDFDFASYFIGFESNDDDWWF